MYAKHLGLVWNRNTCYLATPIPVLPKSAVSLNIGVDDFAFFVCTRVNEDMNKQCVALSLVFECGIAAPAILLHLPLSRQNMAFPINY